MWNIYLKMISARKNVFTQLQICKCNGIVIHCVFGVRCVSPLSMGAWDSPDSPVATRGRDALFKERTSGGVGMSVWGNKSIPIYSHRQQSLHLRFLHFPLHNEYFAIKQIGQKWVFNRFYSSGSPTWCLLICIWGRRRLLIDGDIKLSILVTWEIKCTLKLLPRQATLWRCFTTMLTPCYAWDYRCKCLCW